MTDPAPYDPSTIFGAETSASIVPRSYISPGAYVQGPGVLDRLGHYMGVTSAKAPAVLISKGCQQRFGARVETSLTAAGLNPVLIPFGGECSLNEIEKAVGAITSAGALIDSLIAVGAGKCCDAAKAIAHRLAIPTIICPTLASTDAPCSALSVIYTDQGQVSGVEFFETNPALVVMDTQIVAEAPLRYLVAGIADALATWYEARVCFENPMARSSIGGNTTLAASAIGELCAKTIYAHAEGAIAAVKSKTVNADLDHIVEANTLLSGIGFESGGLAVAHAIATALTAMESVEENCLHGEMVAIGILTQMALEQDTEEEEKIRAFYGRIGLPMHLGQVSIDPARDDALLDTVAAIAADFPGASNEPFKISAADIKRAMLAIHERGLKRTERDGDDAFKALRA